MDLSVPTWVKDAVFYEIFPERFANGDRNNDPLNAVEWGATPTRDNFFGGDLQGIIDRLPYLEELGITAIYLTPIFKAHTNHKYDICDYLEIDPAFGTKTLFHKFVKNAHARGIRVVLDAVFNHCGNGFWAFKDVKNNGPTSKYSSWFLIDSYPIDENLLNYQTAGCTSYLPKLNTINPKVTDYLLKVTTYWIEEFQIDGWRLDIPWKVPKDFWRIFRETVKRTNPDVYIVGEIWREPREWLDGNTCDGVMNYPLRSYLLDYCVYETMDAEDFDYEINRLREDCGQLAPYQMNLLGSHDTPRFLTMCDEDIDRALVALTFLFTYIGAPMIYYGDEVGLLGEHDPDCRRTMPWDKELWNGKLYDTYRMLIETRRKLPILRDGDIETLWVFNAIYAYKRYQGGDEILVILNTRKKRHNVRVPTKRDNQRTITWKDLINGGVYIEEDGYLHMDSMRTKSSYILVPEEIHSQG